MGKLYQAVAVRTGEAKKFPEKLKRILAPIRQETAQRGFSKTFTPSLVDDTGRAKYLRPSEGQDVRVIVDAELPKLWDLFAEMINHNMTVEMANPQATADVFLKGTVEPLWSKVPVTALLALEKDLNQILQQINGLPVNPLDTNWTWSPDRKVWVSPTTVTNTSVREKEYLVVVPATEHHPAQVKDSEKDVAIGTWTTVHFSGSLTQPQIDLLRQRTEELILAVSEARQRANDTVVLNSTMGEQALNYIANGRRPTI